MHVILYNNQSDKRQLSKYLTLVASLDSVQATSDIPTKDPVLKLDYNSAYLNANYLYIQEWGRYYYITNRNCKIGDHIEIECFIDVLMSFNAQIKKAEVIAERSSSNFDRYITDDAIPFTDELDQIVRKLPGSPFTGVSSGSYNYTLLIGGK